MTPPASFKILPSSSQRLRRKESQEVKSGREQPAFSPSQEAMCPRYTTIKRMCGFCVFFLPGVKSTPSSSGKTSPGFDEFASLKQTRATQGVGRKKTVRLRIWAPGTGTIAIEDRMKLEPRITEPTERMLKTAVHLKGREIQPLLIQELIPQCSC